MVRIRPQQLRDLDTMGKQRFVDGSPAYLRRHFADECAAFDDEALRSIAREGVTRAARYGITDVAGAALFVNLMFVLGLEFDSDPEMSWAQLLLRGNSRSRIQDVYAEAMRRLNDPQWGS